MKLFFPPSLCFPLPLSLCLLVGPISSLSSFPLFYLSTFPSQGVPLSLFFFPQSSFFLDQQVRQKISYLDRLNSPVWNILFSPLSLPCLKFSLLAVTDAFSPFFSIEAFSPVFDFLSPK